MIGENEILSDYDGLDQIRLFHLLNIFFFSHKFKNGKKEIINLKNKEKIFFVYMHDNKILCQFHTFISI